MLFLKLFLLKLRKQCSIICTFLIFALGTKIVLQIFNNLVITDLTELHTCPFCYGTSACKTLNNNKIDILHYKVYSSLFGTKNVYYAIFNGTKVVLKKLASNEELENFDKMINNNKTYIVNTFLNSNNKKKYKIAHSLLTVEMTSDMSDVNVKLRLCPSIYNVNKLLKNLHTVDKNEIEIYINIWTLLKINPEPLVLQILSAKHGWPVPHYYGACGRLIMEQYVGPSLTSYYDVSWIRRAKMASSLLAAAYRFTFGHTDFAFYFTDVSWDNFAVDTDDNVKFIDLENIIIVDKMIMGKDISKSWNEIHRSETIAYCKSCFVFSPTDICHHKLSDHNYFAVCQHIISPSSNNTNSHSVALLHDVPVEIVEHFPNLLFLMQQCSDPNSLLDNRIIFGIRLKKILDEIIASYKNIHFW